MCLLGFPPKTSE